MSKHTILITGASSGIGYQIARLAVQRGHVVVASAPDAFQLESIPTECQHRLVIDVCDSATIRAALEYVAHHKLDISCLVNNAGYAQPGPMELVDDERLRKQFDVNFFGTLALTRAVLPLLRERGAGRIITLSSVLGRVSLPFQGAYASSKFALEAAFEALRMELLAFRIHVVLIDPGWINTGFLKTALAHASSRWLDHPVYGKALGRYFSISREAEGERPTGAARVAAALSGSPLQVALTVIRAIEAPKPKARYPVTAMARWMPLFRSLTPTAWWDRMQTDAYQ